MKQLRLWSAVAPLVFAAWLPGRAQQAATIPASSRIYGQLEAVSARFPSRGVFLGERPLSHREVRRVVARLAAAIDSAGPRGAPEAVEWARRELADVTEALDSERETRPYGGRLVLGGALRTELFSSDAVGQRIESNGMGLIDAVTHPFAPRREGWPTGQGTVATLAPTALVAGGNSLAIVVEPAFTAGHFRDGAEARDVFLHRAYARATAWNVSIQLGADERLWGQSPVSALFLSGHAGPMPALVVGTDTAITLPWWFRFAGPVRVVGMVADLGAAQDPPHPRLAGWQASMQPWSRFELGVSMLAQTGGGDCESRQTCASLFRRFVDLFPIIDALAPQHADLQISNKLAGGNLRLRLPELSGSDFYYELQMDDFDGRRLGSSFVEDAAHLLGLRVPLLVGDGLLAWRLEWHRTSLRLYEHGQYRSGATFRSRIFGDPLGPNAQATYLSGNWQPSPATTLQLDLADERRDPSHYVVVVTGPRESGFVFRRDIVRPDFHRRRMLLAFERPLGLGALRVAAGYNRAWQEGQPARSEWLGVLSLSTQRLRAF